MNCERSQAAISQRMDGVHLSSSLSQAIEEHVASCARCRAFADRSARIRTAVRIRPAERIPDLTEPIMASVVRAARGGGGGGPAPLALPSQTPHRGAATTTRRRLAPVAAALVVGLVAGSVAVGGPWQTASTRSIAAAAVVRGVQNAASSIDHVQASYAITERGLSPEVSVRHLTMRVAFRSPGRYRLDVRDDTTYPSSAWTPTDLTYIANGPSTYTSGPTGCPSDLPAGVCPPTRTTVTRDEPFDVGAPVPADLVLPLTTLGSSGGVRVVGTGSALGRETVIVELTFARARPLFPFLGLGGTWRPFFAGDRVVVSLDRSSWFPLRATVYPASGPERRAWELRFGLPVEPASGAILDEVATSVDASVPPTSAFAIPGGGAPTLSLSQLSTAVGYVPITPTEPDGLRLASAVAPPPADPNTPTSLLTYAQGVSYLVIGERPGWSGPGPFGPLDTNAERVTVGANGVGYYGPATQDHGRVLGIHTTLADLYLETNLPRDRLLSLASSLPVAGVPLPAAWWTSGAAGLTVRRVTLAVARASVSFPIDLPTTIPAGSELASVELDTAARSTGATLSFVQRQVDVAGTVIRLHVERAATLPSAVAPGQLHVSLAGATDARWTPSLHRLEWLEGGLYRSLDGASLDLSVALAIAGSIPSGDAEGSTP